LPILTSTLLLQLNVGVDKGQEATTPLLELPRIGLDVPVAQRQEPSTMDSQYPLLEGKADLEGRDGW
jgi:hypothetical protein